MKRSIITLASMFCLAASVLLADPIKLSVAVISTNAAPLASDTCTNDTGFLHGYVNAVTLDLTTATASPTCTVVLVTVGDEGSGPAQQVFAKSITGDGRYYPRVSATDTNGVAVSGEYTQFALWQDHLVLKAYGLNFTNAASLAAWVDIVPLPY